MEKTVFIHLPTASITPPRNEPDLHMAFEVGDSSMSDGTRHGYEQGDIVTGRRIAQQHWWSQIRIAHYDLILMHRCIGILLKKVISHDADTGTIRLHSLNENYADFDIDIRDVTQLYNVIKVERKK